jgi:predicted heme/steroid binding protein
MVVQAIGIVTDLRSQNKNLSYLYMASGLLSDGDNGGGLFWWNPASTAADDGVNVIQVTGVATGRWVRIFDSSAGVPSTRQLTINGVTYDLSANRTWNVGTVTGTGTANYMTKFTSAGVIGDSNMLFSSTASSTNWTIGSTSGSQNNTTSLSLAAVTESRFEANASDGYHAEFTNSYGNVYILATKPSPDSDNNYILYYNGSSTSNRYLAFQTNGADRIRVSQAGDVSIGGTSALAKLDIYGDLNVRTIINAVTDTDKFLVSDGGIVKYRTGAQVLSDIGAQPAGNYVLESRTLTINGTTYDLSANRTWNVGTVTGTGTNSYLALWNSSTGITTSGILQVGTAGYFFDTNSDFGTNFNFRNNATNSMTYAIELVNYSSPKATKHTYTSGIVISEIANSFVNRIFANGNHIIGNGITDNGYKLEVQGTGRFTGALTIDTIANATIDTDRFLVSDSGVVKYRTGAQLLSDIGGQPAGSYVTTSRTLTINGTAYDLSADRTWSVGTVTSVQLSAGTGISLAGTNPITTSGTITVTNTAPDQIVTIAAGENISVSGTYPNFTVSATGEIISSFLLMGA